MTSLDIAFCEAYMTDHSVGIGVHSSRAVVVHSGCWLMEYSIGHLVSLWTALRVLSYILDTYFFYAFSISS